jgi:hypothetical protein
MECSELSPLYEGDLSPSSGLDRGFFPSRCTQLCLAGSGKSGDPSPHSKSLAKIREPSRQIVRIFPNCDLHFPPIRAHPCSSVVELLLSG